VEKIQVSLHLTRMTGTSRERRTLYVFDHILLKSY